MYENFNDNELLYMINQNDQFALSILYNKYRVIIEYKIVEIIYDKALYHQYVDEMRQLGLILLGDCATSYTMTKKAKFSTFFGFCLERKIRNQLKSYLCNRYQYVNAMSLDAPVNALEEFTIADNVETLNYDCKTESVLKHKYLLEIIDKTTASFTKIEKTICRLKQEGYTYPEIVEGLQVKYKKVDNTMQKFRKSLRSCLEANDYW